MTEYKICICGKGGVGKSALTIQFIQNHFMDEYDPTIEDSYHKQVSIDGKSCLIDILDTAGQEEYFLMREHYMSISQGFILVYSITSKDSFEELNIFRNQICKVKDEINIPIVIAGNKCDMENFREVSTIKGKELSLKYGYPFFETSALTRFNVDEIFYEEVREIIKYQNIKQNIIIKKKSNKNCHIF